MQNLVRLMHGNFMLKPCLAVYYVTVQCNLNCTYCEDFGSRRNQQAAPNPSLADAKRILEVTRTGVDRLWITGGEPFLVPHLFDLLEYARNRLHFREISLITNGTLLSQRLNLLPLLDRLIVSLDSADPQTLSAVSLPGPYSETVLANIRTATPLQKTHTFQLILNAVLTPETLSGIDGLLAFSQENHVHISFSPQSTNNLPRYELVTSPAYQAAIDKIISRKKQGAPILGSLSYFKVLKNQIPYECYPTLIPRILPDGWLAYPCRPMEKAGGEQGGKAVNLLNVQSWEEAWNTAKEKYGDAPTSCVSCFQQCYAEPSLMQARPFEYMEERLRGHDLSVYAPG